MTVSLKKMCFVLSFFLFAEIGLGQSPGKNRVKEFAQLVSIDFGTPANGLFSSADKCVVTARFKLKKNMKTGFDYQWEIQDAAYRKIEVSKIGQFSLAQKNSIEKLSRHFSPAKAGFYNIVLRARVSAGNEKAKDPNAWLAVKKFRIGFQPEKIQSPLTRQADFDDFWQQSKTELAAIEPGFTARLVEDKSDEDYKLYEVEMKSLGGIRVGGWLEVPSAGSPVPCLLRVPGYTQNMKPVGKTKTKGIAVFSFNIRGHGNSQKDVPGKPQDYWVRGLDGKSDYFYRGAYMDCVRAVEFLKTRSSIDAKRIGVRGGSQGGGLALVTAALNEEIVLCVADIPFLVDWVNYFRITDWPEMNQWIATRESRTWDSTLKTMSYFDLLNFVQGIKCETVMGIGLQDPVCPPTTIFSTFNRIRSKKTFFVYPTAGHWVPSQHHVVAWELIRERLSAQ